MFRDLGVWVGPQANRRSLACLNVTSSPSHCYHYQNSRYKIYYNCHIGKHPEAVICFHYCTYSSLKCRIVNYVLIKMYYVECLGIIFATSLIQMFLMNNPQGKMISSASLISSTDFLLFIFAFLSSIYKQE